MRKITFDFALQLCSEGEGEGPGGRSVYFGKKGEIDLSVLSVIQENSSLSGLLFVVCCLLFVVCCMLVVCLFVCCLMIVCFFAPFHSFFLTNLKI